MRRRRSCWKALAHPLRLRIALRLWKCGCRNVGCMEANTGQSQSCISPAPDAPQGRRGGQGRPVGNEVDDEIANPEVAAVLSALFGDREEEYQCTISR